MTTAVGSARMSDARAETGCDLSTAKERVAALGAG